MMPVAETDHKYVERSNAAEEGSIWREFQHGNKSAYSYIYEQYSDKLYNYGMHLVANNELVEDAIQDLFVNLWRCRENLASVKSITFYLLTCLRREIIKKIKKENRFITSDHASDKMSFQFSRSLEDDMIEEQVCFERKMKIDHILLSLSKRQQEIIYLKFYEDLSYCQIAEQLGLDLKYTYNVASRAFCIIRKHFVSASACFLLLFAC